MNKNNDGRSPRSGTQPPRAHRFGQPDGNPRGDQHTAALAHAAKNRTIAVLSEALNADEAEFERILVSDATPYVARKLLQSFHGDGPMNSQGVRALLALWQTVFPQEAEKSGDALHEEIINDAMPFPDDADTVLIREIRYPADDKHRLPGYMLDPRDGSSHMMTHDVNGVAGYIPYIKGTGDQKSVE